MIAGIKRMVGKVGRDDQLILPVSIQSTNQVDLSQNAYSQGKLVQHLVSHISRQVVTSLWLGVSLEAITHHACSLIRQGASLYQKKNIISRVVLGPPQFWHAWFCAIKNVISL